MPHARCLASSYWRSLTEPGECGYFFNLGRTRVLGMCYHYGSMPSGHDATQSLVLDSILLVARKWNITHG
jgi:hypothetical protein